MAWPRQTWQITLPEHGEFLSRLPDRLNRDAVREYGALAAESERHAVQAFIATMAWGYGPAGYAAYRTARILRGNEKAPMILREAAERAQRDGGLEAFVWFKGHRLRRLGVAFATKYLYACRGSGVEAALILDSMVQRWLRRHADLTIRLTWHAGDYRNYLQLAAAWATDLGLPPETVEYLMFDDAARDEPGSPWASQQTGPDRAATPEDEEMASVLESLDEALAAFAALPGLSSPADIEDFERGIRQLRRIVLARDRITSFIPVEPE
jgi:hypothetical protein